MTSDRLLPPGGLPPGAGLPAPMYPPQGAYPPPALRADDEMTVRDLWYAMIRNRWLILGALSLGIGGAIMYAERTTPVFQAATSIRIDEKQSSIPVLDMLSDVGAGSELATEMEVLRSRSLAETVVDSLSLQVSVVEPRSARRNELLSVLAVADSVVGGEFILDRAGNGFWLEGSSRRIVPGERFTLGGADLVLKPAASGLPHIVISVVPFQRAVSAFSQQLTVSRPQREANVVIASYQGHDPDLVGTVPNVLAQKFIVSRNAVKKTEARSTIVFLRQQIDTLSRQLAASEDSLRIFREDAQVVSLPDEASSQVSRLAALQGERASIDAERSALNALLTEVRAAAASARVEDPSPYRRLLAFPTLLRNPAISQMLGALNQMENERTELLIRRTTRDPDVVTLTVRVREMEEQIRTLATTYLQGLTNQVASIDSELARFNVRLQQVPAKEVAYARLVRQPKVLEGVYTMLQSRLKEAEIVQAVEDPSVRVVDQARVPQEPVKPNKPLIVLLGGMLGLMTGIGGAVLRQSLDRKVRSRDDVLRITGFQVLGIIPRIDDASERPQLGMSMLKRLAISNSAGNAGPSGRSITSTNGTEVAPAFASRLVTGNDPRNPISEAYRTLRTNITFSRLESVPKTLVFTSPMPGDGKSTSASNLAITLAQQGLRVLLVDADMRRGVLNDVFHQPRDPGLSNVILGRVDATAAIRRIDLGSDIQMDLLPSGTLPPNPAELVGSERMRDLLKRLEEVYDTIILDSPPLNVVTDAALLGTKADGVLVVTRVGKTDVHDLEYAMIQLSNVRAPVLGIVLNDVDIKGSARYGYGGYGSYQYYYSETA